MDGRTGTTLLRRYEIKSDDWESFLDVWRRIVVVRKRHGFQVLFAFEDREENVFTWAIHHPGDIDKAADLYYKDPERVELEIVERYVTGWKVTTVTEVAIP